MTSDHLGDHPTTGVPSADVADPRERQRAWIRLAQARLAAFVRSSAGEVDQATREAESALRDAVSSGTGIEVLSAELEVSPRALRAIVDGSVPLRSLHPDGGLRPA
ncbi:hypothetical protein ACIPVB_06870 [Microbacterium sp. NPDC090007]|uniref:hypothetical protein n=1 Tax=Microbacterium sp. NPDC090007 TaxID=3364204 RepID=UPI00382600C8